jgi:hypothetical protein
VTRPDLDLLGSLVDGATPGPWIVANDGCRYVACVGECPTISAGGHVDPDERGDHDHPAPWRKDAAYLAALSPEVVRSLIADATIGRLAREVRAVGLREQARIHSAGGDPSVSLESYSRIVTEATDHCESTRAALEAALRSEEARP